MKTKKRRNAKKVNYNRLKDSGISFDPEQLFQDEENIISANDKQRKKK